MNIKKTAAVVLALSFVSSTGCSLFHNDKKDAELLLGVTGAFIDALAAGDQTAAESLADGFDYVSQVEDNYMPGTRDIILHSLQYMEVTSFGEAEFDRKNGTAEVEAEISYIDLEDFMDSGDSQYYTYEGYIERMDSYEDLAVETMDLQFTYDEDARQWLLSKGSAKDIVRLYISDIFRLTDPVPISPEDGLQMFYDYFDSVATGKYGDLPSEFDFDANRVYENVTVVGEGDLTQEALENFISAYVAYVMDHDPVFSIDESDYSFVLHGVAPCDEDLYAAITTDEFFAEYYATMIRYNYLSLGPEDMWDMQSALIYNALADAVASADPEEYQITGYIEIFDTTDEDGNDASDYELVIPGSLILEPFRGLYEAEHGVGEEQYIRACSEAVWILYRNGEITESFRDRLLAGITYESDTFVPAGGTSESGHENQALGTYEQVPDWCEDGSLVYGCSFPDENGCWMFYSKDPEVLDSVGYCVDREGLWINNTFYDGFAEGATLIVDWWIDGELVVDTEYVIIDHDDATEVEVFLPLDHLPDMATIEMRLWDENHSLVLSYVTITVG